VLVLEKGNRGGEDTDRVWSIRLSGGGYCRLEKGSVQIEKLGKRRSVPMGLYCYLHEVGGGESLHNGQRTYPSCCWKEGTMVLVHYLAEGSGSRGVSKRRQGDGVGENDRQ